MRRNEPCAYENTPEQSSEPQRIITVRIASERVHEGLRMPEQIILVRCPAYDGVPRVSGLYNLNKQSCFTPLRQTGRGKWSDSRLQWNGRILFVTGEQMQDDIPVTRDGPVRDPGIRA